MNDVQKDPTSLTAGDVGGSVDTGYFKILQGLNILGYIHAPAAGFSRWTLFAPVGGPSGYDPPSLVSTRQNQYVFMNGVNPQTYPPPPVIVPPLPAIPSGSTHCNVVTTFSGGTPPAGSKTFQLGQHSWTTPQPVIPGMYKISQKTGGGPILFAGKLLVEPFEGGTRMHFFMHGAPVVGTPGGSGQYVKAGLTATPVLTTYEPDTSDIFDKDLNTIRLAVKSLYVGAVSYCRDDVMNWTSHV